MRKPKVLPVIGTRPEAIKLAPVIQALTRDRRFRVRVCTTGQHRHMLAAALALFDLTPAVELGIMRRDQSLFHVAARTLQGLQGVLERERPDLVLVQGDTTTTLAASLAAFYGRVPVAHVEAGLRTFDRSQPFPEEMHRKLIASLARYHFAPTLQAAVNLRRQGVPAHWIWRVGNPVVDALAFVRSRQEPADEQFRWRALFLDRWGLDLSSPGPLILMTSHRRENLGSGQRRIFQAALEIVERHPGATIAFPVHPNPNVRETARAMLRGRRRIHLLPPLDYDAFIYLLQHCHLVLTDSGGVQEEATVLGRPVLVLREVTDRNESVAAGQAKLVGTDPVRILRETDRLLRAPAAAGHLNRRIFGDGRTASRIVRILAAQMLVR